jgi:hypothetical protein
VRQVCEVKHFIKTYVDKLVKVTLSQVMKNRGIVKISQVGHVFAFFVLGRVDLSNKIFLDIFDLFFVNVENHGKIFLAQ